MLTITKTLLNSILASLFVRLFVGGLVCAISIPTSHAFLSSHPLPMTSAQRRSLQANERLPPSAYKFEDDSDFSLPNGGKGSIVDLDSESNGPKSPEFADPIKNNDEVDIVGGGTLGDIMTRSSVTDEVINGRLGSAYRNLRKDNKVNTQQTAIVDGLVTREGGELNARFSGCNFTPMERIALTANGNLQRIFSSFYDAPVHVHVDSCSRRCSSDSDKSSPPNEHEGSMCFNNMCSPVIDGSHAVWDRVVRISVHGKTICKATSIIHVESLVCVRLIEEGKVGLGQLFRYLNKLPTFSLLDAGRNEPSSLQNDFEGGMWRTYELQCEEMTCLIHEEFRKDAWNILSDNGFEQSQ